jgi:HlyD family secretion protein
MQKTFLHQIRAVFKKTSARVFTILILAILVGVAFASGGSKNSKSGTVRVERGTIVKSIEITGKTKPKSSVDLSFERAGQVARVLVRVGDQVAQGQTLVELDRSLLLADLNDAKANLDIQRGKLAELKTGSSPETIQLKKTAITKAENSLAVAKQNVVEKVSDAYTKADNAIHNNIDQFISGPNSANPILSFNVADGQLKSNIEVGRVLAGNALSSLHTVILELDPNDNLQNAANTAKQHLNTIKNFLDLTAIAVNILTSSSLSQTTIDAYKAAVSSARDDVNTAIQNISTANEKLSDAVSDLAIAEQNLQIALSGGTAEQITTQEAYVRQAEAKVQSVNTQIAKTILRAPLAGIITREDADIGEIAEQYKPLVSIIGSGGLEVEAQVPEIDIGALAVGNPASITIDAFPGETFAGKVGSIDPAETLIDGVVNFRIKIFFTTEDTRLKSGLTSNILIETARAEGVLILPESAVIRNSAGVFAKRVLDGDVVNVPIVVGLRDNQSLIEIVEGLSEGDMVVNGGKVK